MIKPILHISASSSFGLGRLLGRSSCLDEVHPSMLRCLCLRNDWTCHQRFVAISNFTRGWHVANHALQKITRTTGKSIHKEHRIPHAIILHMPRGTVVSTSHRQLPKTAGGVVSSLCFVFFEIDLRYRTLSNGFYFSLRTFFYLSAHF